MDFKILSMIITVSAILIIGALSFRKMELYNMLQKENKARINAEDELEKEQSIHRSTKIELSTMKSMEHKRKLDETMEHKRKLDEIMVVTKPINVNVNKHPKRRTPQRLQQHKTTVTNGKNSTAYSVAHSRSGRVQSEPVHIIDLYDDSHRGCSDTYRSEPKSTPVSTPSYSGGDHTPCSSPSDSSPCSCD